MLIIREAQMKSLAQATGGKPVLKCKLNSWIEIRLVDTDGQPVGGMKYILHLPDSTVIEGVLDNKGAARAEDVVPGTCKVSFPEIDASELTPV
jgi:hypothetical protein